MGIPDPEKGITGFCPCCGEPRVYGRLVHNEECLWAGEIDIKDEEKDNGGIS